MFPSSKPIRDGFFRVVAACFLAISMGTPLLAQGFGKIVGTVTGPQGLGVQDARVTVTEVATGLQSTTVTSPDGLYTVPALPPTQSGVTLGSRRCTQPQSA